MEHASSAGSGEAQATALSESWDAWEEYYRKASIRRRTRGGRRQLREEKRRRRLRERIGIMISAFIVGGMTLIFYLVLTHH
ncbi:MAG TPA: hypothetical protein VN962_26730 [Polyangia bacterium]|nr:hypothetical protein [Polyangia bacterium]